MGFGAPKELSECRRFFLEPANAKQRMYEALRAYFIGGFAPLPRRLDQERHQGLRPTIEAVADVRQLSLAPRTFTTCCGGLFLFVPDLVRLHLDSLVQAAHLRSEE